MNEVKTLEIKKLSKEKEGKLKYCHQYIYHVWLYSIATDKVLVDKQEQIEKLTREKEGKLQ